MEIYSQTEQKIIEALGEFQFLTSSQMVRLGITKTRKGVYKSLANLVNSQRPLVARLNYEISPLNGRPEAIHYLTHFGVRLLEENLEADEIKAPRRVAVAFTSDYKHRVSVINLFIDLRKWADEQGYQIDHTSFYFEQNAGSNRHNKGGKSLADNRLDIGKGGIDYIIPDGVAIVDRGEKKPLFAMIEQHNGKDAKRFLKQAYGHTLAISEGLPSIKYDVKHDGDYVANRVFCVFEHPACMASAMYRLAKSEDFQPFLPLFCFKSEEAMEKTGFGTGWVLANGKPASFA